MVANESDRQMPESNRLNIGKTELKDLSWEDREKILRVIFAKITLGVSNNYWSRIDNERHKKRDESYHLPTIQKHSS